MSDEETGRICEYVGRMVSLVKRRCKVVLPAPGEAIGEDSVDVALRSWPNGLNLVSLMIGLKTCPSNFRGPRPGENAIRKLVGLFNYRVSNVFLV